MIDSHHSHVDKYGDGGNLPGESDRTDWNWTENKGLRYRNCSQNRLWSPSTAMGLERIMNESRAHFTTNIHSLLLLHSFFLPCAFLKHYMNHFFCVVLTATQEKFAGISSSEHARWTNKHACTWNASVCLGHKTHGVKTKYQTTQMPLGQF